MALKETKNRKQKYEQGTTHNWSSARLKKFLKYQKEYSTKHYRDFHFRLNVETDKKIIEYLDNVPSLTDFIRKSVRKKAK